MADDTSASARARQRIAEILDKYGVYLDEVEPDTPLRLDIAAAIAFPDGTMSGRALRRAMKKYDVPIEQIGRKDYTTLFAIGLMRAASKAETRMRLATPEAVKDRPFDEGALNLERYFEAERQRARLEREKEKAAKKKRELILARRREREKREERLKTLTPTGKRRRMRLKPGNAGV